MESRSGSAAVCNTHGGFSKCKETLTVSLHFTLDCRLLHAIEFSAQIQRRFLFLFLVNWEKCIAAAFY